MASSDQRPLWTLRHSYSEAILNLCVSAIQVFMWAYMTSFYFHWQASSETRKRRRPYLIVSLAILVLSSASHIIGAMQTYELLLEVTPELEGVEVKMKALQKYGHMSSVARCMLRDLAIRVADAVLLYRCYIVWLHRAWVMVVPVSMFLAGIGMNTRIYIPLDFAGDAKLEAADTFLFVALNALLTCLISFRLLRAQKKFKSALPYMNHKVYLGIISILVESAAPIAVFGLIFSIAILNQEVFEGYQMFYVFKFLFITAAILSPQIIIFRINTGNSWANTADTEDMLSRPIEFASTCPTIRDV